MTYMNEFNLFNLRYNEIFPEDIIEWYMESGEWDLLDQYYNNVIEGRSL